LTAGGAAILIAAASQRDALVGAETTRLGLAQADEMLAMTLVVCIGVAMLSAAFGLARSSGLVKLPTIPKRGALIATGLAAVMAIGLFVVVDGPDRLSNGWDEFRAQDTQIEDAANPIARLTSAGGNGRYQFWSAAVDAAKAEPLVGIGSGSYEYWYARNGDGGFVRDAHSLYLETLGELGIVGLLLLLGALLIPTGSALVSATRFDANQRRVAAAAAAAMITFLVAAAIDWVWELTVLPIIFVLIAAAVLGQRAKSEGVVGRGASRGMRVGLGVAAVATLVAVAVPLSSAKSLRASQEAGEAGNLGMALTNALDAESSFGGAASPHLHWPWSTRPPETCARLPARRRLRRTESRRTGEPGSRFRGLRRSAATSKHRWPRTRKPQLSTPARGDSPD